MADKTPEQIAAEKTAAAEKAGKTSKLKSAELPEEGTAVSLQKHTFDGKSTESYMWIEGTGASKHLKKGEKHEVHKISGEKLISKGAAVKTTAPVKAKPATTKSKKDEDDD